MRFSILLAVLLSPSLSAADLKIYFIDVEQVDATLIVSPSGNTLLIDSGKNGMGPRLKSVMDDAGVAQIDHFVATHYHEDHYGGIDDLIEDQLIVVTNGYDRGDKQFLPQDKLDEVTYKDYQRVIGTRARHLMRGETIPLDDEMLVLVISSGGVVLGEQNATPGKKENDMSVSLLIQYGDFQLFVGGDIEHSSEKKIADIDLIKDVDIYQANHHGSHSSTSSDFMADLSPTVVTISNGSAIKYQHPRQVTLNTLSNLSPVPTVLQTNKYVAGGTDFGNTIDANIADLPPNDKKGTIKVVVNKAAQKYTATYASTSKSFDTKQDPAAPNVTIESLIANPAGSDYLNEQVTLKNNSNQAASIDRMKLIDESGRVWLLQGSIAPNGDTTIIRNGMPMSLNNNGDVIRLLAPNGAEIDSIGYSGTQLEGAVVQ